MHTTARAVAAPLLIAALLLGAGYAVPTTAGASTKTYTDSAHGISFRYPATWNALPHLENTGYAATIAKTAAAFAPPDFSVEFVDIVGDKKLAGAALQSAGLKLFKDGAKLASPITTGHATIGEHAFYTWSGKVTFSSGDTALTTIYAGAGSAGTYYLGTVIVSHPAASAKALRAILDSVTIR